ncbi:hypothetical protein ACFXPQ_01710 [Streptomyces lydicus]|uniref:hypothetical protein n=1 Tax=Streptomyces lydicus TaxID=47763 RepID=UPI00368A6953
MPSPADGFEQQVLFKASQFTGALDEVRVYRRALTDAELSRVRSADAPVGGPLVLGLSLDRVRGAARS